jgi:hypothetical protein
MTQIREEISFTNGDGFVFHDRTATGDNRETTIELDAFTRAVHDIQSALYEPAA